MRAQRIRPTRAPFNRADYDNTRVILLCVFNNFYTKLNRSFWWRRLMVAYNTAHCNNYYTCIELCYGKNSQKKKNPTNILCSNTYYYDVDSSISTKKIDFGCCTTLYSSGFSQRFRMKPEVYFNLFLYPLSTLTY